MLRFYGIELQLSVQEDEEIFVEGARTRTVTIKEEVARNPEARAKCLEIKGSKCIICGFDSFEEYQVAGIIHVHHLHPIAESEGQRKVDPEKDLVPVCPNCHAVIHSKKNGIYTPDEVKALKGLI